MPVQKRGLPIEIAADATRAKRSKRETEKCPVLQEMDKIGYVTDEWHSLHRNMPEDCSDVCTIIDKEICAFLNSSGGILCFGCRHNGTVYGIQMSRKEEDNVKCLIDDVMKRFHPFLMPNQYRVLFKQVAPFQASEVFKVVIEIKVNPGAGCCIYEDENHNAYCRKNNGVHGPLTPAEIKEIVTKKFFMLKRAEKKAASSSQPAVANVVSINHSLGNNTKLKLTKKEPANSSSAQPTVAIVRPCLKVAPTINNPLGSNTEVKEKTPPATKKGAKGTKRTDKSKSCDENTDADSKTGSCVKKTGANSKSDPCVKTADADSKSDEPNIKSRLRSVVIRKACADFKSDNVHMTDSTSKSDAVVKKTKSNSKPRSVVAGRQHDANKDSLKSSSQENSCTNVRRRPEVSNKNSNVSSQENSCSTTRRQPDSNEASNKNSNVSSEEDSCTAAPTSNRVIVIKAPLTAVTTNGNNRRYDNSRLLPPSFFTATKSSSVKSCSSHYNYVPPADRYHYRPPSYYKSSYNSYGYSYHY